MVDYLRIYDSLNLEMKESKISRARDRLSELPESLIFHIFWLLPMRYVVRTTILSKHWRNLWTTAPCLNFSIDEDMDNVQVRNFINRALMLWEGMKIQKFKIDLGGENDKSFFRDFDLWLHFALRKEVQELYVHNPYVSETYLVPQYLYSCSSLKVLSLDYCGLEITGNVQWNQLKSLTIEGADMGDDDVINKVLCGSPQLEVFILTLVDCYYEHLSIRSSSLKRFSIHYFIWGSFLCGELRIWTPNLENLEILGVPYRKYSLMDVSSLTHVTLGFNDRHEIVDGSGDLLGEALREIFPTIQHVENVTLSEDFCIKVLGDLIKKGLIPSSSNAKFLKLNYHCVEYEQIVGVLEIFPKLEMLVLKADERYHSRQYVRESLKFDANVPKSFLLHLRTIEITWDEDDNSMSPFIKIMLKYASKLKKMVVRVAPPAPRSKSMVLLLQKMPRSSPNAELIFCEY